MRCPLCRHVVPFDDAETIDLMRKNVERGDTAAMTQLGLYYRDGKMGLRVDLGRAASYYARAAALGHLGAMVDLGIACEGGRGVPRDAAAAAGWYRKAADGGHARATLNLGVLHAEGRGVRRDAAEAARLYAEAADVAKRTGEDAAGAVLRCALGPVARHGAPLGRREGV